MRARALLCLIVAAAAVLVPTPAVAAPSDAIRWHDAAGYPYLSHDAIGEVHECAADRSGALAADVSGSAGRTACWAQVATRFKTGKQAQTLTLTWIVTQSEGYPSLSSATNTWSGPVDGPVYCFGIIGGGHSVQSPPWCRSLLPGVDQTLTETLELLPNSEVDLRMAVSAGVTGKTSCGDRSGAELVICEAANAVYYPSSPSAAVGAVVSATLH